MYDDLNILYCNINNNLWFGKTYFIEKDYYDEQKFPNIIENGYEYFNKFIYFEVYYFIICYSLINI